MFAAGLWGAQGGRGVVPGAIVGGKVGDFTRVFTMDYMTLFHTYMVICTVGKTKTTRLDLGKMNRPSGSES